MNYLDNYFSEFYASDPDTDFDGSASFPTSFATGPERIEFDFTAIFAEDSNVFPRQADVDQLILTALSPPAANLLVAQLNQLPDSNPFSQTFALDYEIQNYRLPLPTASPSIRDLTDENYNAGAIPTLSPAMTRRPTSPFDVPVVDPNTEVSAPPISSPMLIKNSNSKSESGSKKTSLIVVIVVAIAGGLLALLVLEVRRMKRAERRSDESDMALRQDDEASHFLSDGEEVVSTDPKATKMVPPMYNDMKELSPQESWSTGESEETDQDETNNSAER